jgi:hypothetical protein
MWVLIAGTVWVGVVEEDVELVILDDEGVETTVLELDFDELELDGFVVERDDEDLEDVDEILVEEEEPRSEEDELEIFELVEDVFVEVERVEVTDLEVDVEVLEVDVTDPLLLLLELVGATLLLDEDDCAILDVSIYISSLLAAPQYS